MKIRKLKNSDYPVVKEINEVLKEVSIVERQWLSEGERKFMFARGRTRYSESRIIENDQKVPIGFLFTIFDKDKLRDWLVDSFDIDHTLYLYCLAVKKEYQYKGYGAALWEETLRIAIKHHKKYILLDVNSKNAKAYSWYRRLGFEELASQVWMLKKLNK